MRLLLFLLSLLVAAPGAAARPHVYLVIIDGLDARFATRERMPALFDVLAREPAHSSFLAGRAVMPARTNPNHATLLTGVYAETHGITGNAYWDRTPGARPAKLDAAAALEVETLFTVARQVSPAVRTLGVFAKPKLARLFARVPGRQEAPDVLWSPEDGPPGARDPLTGYSRDADTMAAVLAHVEVEPDLTVVNIADVDRNGHGRGPDSVEYAQAVTEADAAIGRLVTDLERRGRWRDAVLVVTADHGFTSLLPTADRPHPVITLGDSLERAGIEGVRLVGEGGVEYAYGEKIAADATSAGAAGAVLARVAELARGVPGVAEVVARLPVDGVPALAERHPDWHLAHQRAGDLLIVAAPGYQLVDPPDPIDASLLGNHGGPQDRSVPLVVTGGSPAIVAAPAGTPSPVAVDVAPTIAALLGLPPPRRVDGGTLAPAATGRPIAAVLAAPAQNPH